MNYFPVVTAVLLASALPAQAKVRVADFSTGVGVDRFDDAEPVVSHDGYHFAAVSIGTDGLETLYKDGRELGRGSPGTYTAPSDSRYERRPSFHAVISDNGALFHSMRFQEQGRTGNRVAVDAIPKGALYERILQVVASPRGDNVAFVTADGGHYAVSTLSGRTPLTKSPPRIAGASSSGVFYEFQWNGRDWNYKDLDALPYRDYLFIAANPLRPSLAGIFEDSRGASLEVDGKESGGPWLAAGSPFYSAEGKLAVPARTRSTTARGEFDAVVVDGRARPVPNFELLNGFNPTASPIDGTPFTVSGTYGTAVLAIGEKTRPDLGKPLSARGWVGFSPSGRRWAMIASGEKRLQPVVDGRVGEESATAPLADARLVFDSETEFHYMGSSLNSIVLTCVTLDGQDPETGRCGRRAAAYGYKPHRMKAAVRVLDAPKLEPGSLKVTPQ